jgi:RecA/RadA recombinase
MPEFVIIDDGHDFVAVAVVVVEAVAALARRRYTTDEDRNMALTF